MDENSALEIVRSTGLPRPSVRLIRHSPTARKYTKEQKTLLLANIAVMLQRRMTMKDIGDELGLSVATVKLYIGKLEQEWLERASGTFTVLRARELTELDRVQATAEAGYEKSKKRRMKTTTRADFVRDTEGGGRKAQPSVQQITQQDQDEGDPRFLTIILQCIDRRIKLMGLDEPTKFEVHSGVGQHGKGRTPVEERFNTALALVGVTVNVTGAEAESRIIDGHGVAKPLDSGYTDEEAS